MKICVAEVGSDIDDEVVSGSSSCQLFLPGGNGVDDRIEVGPEADHRRRKV
jgi:hypothetical protein